MKISRLLGLIGLPMAAISASVTAQEFRESPFYYFELEGNMTADVTLADIDGDGDLDVLAANGRHWAQPDWAYLNDGSGRLLEANPIGAGRGASYTIRAIDLDGDDDLDAVVVRDRLPIQIYHNDGFGNFAFAGTTEGSGGAARGAEVLDANQDGLDDLMVFRRRGDNLLFLNDGQGGLSAAKPVTAEGHGATGGDSADLDGDGDIDVAIARRDGNASLILENDGAGNFTAHLIADSVGDRRKLVIGDFTNDGLPDIAIAGGDGRLLLYAGQGSLDFATPVSITVGEQSIQSLVAADLDMDGDIDLVAGVEGTNSLLLNNGAGSFTRSHLPEDDGDTYGLAVGDMNGDNIPDIVVANSQSTNRVLRGTNE